MTATDNMQQISPPTPATDCSWRFGDLSAAELMPLLQQHLATQDAELQWQLIWLNNDGCPVIGLLPKMTWCVYFNPTSDRTLTPNYKVIKNCRDNNSVTTACMSYAQWQNELIIYNQAYENDNTSLTSINKNEEKPFYHHGLMGFIGYDIAAIELSSNSNIQQATQPSAFIGHYDIYLTPSDENKEGWTLNIKTPAANDTNSQLENSKLSALISYLNTLDNVLSVINSAEKATVSLEPLMLTAKWHKSDYQQAFVQTQRYLVQGDCYQINLTQAWRGQFDNTHSDNKTTTLIDYLPALHRNTRAPFAGYLGVSSIKDNRLATDTKYSALTFELLSCSPELFFTFITDDNTSKHHIRTKPIKGTVPRGKNTEQDLALKQQLIDSDKDRAENVMIVDLLRNDLGKYAKVGSVKVPQLFNIESFSNVHHMVSTITAELKTDTHPLAVLFGSLPAGSITGTPKKRAVEIIAELEAAPRGAYCGTMGYMNFDGSGQWNVLIRTLQADSSSSTSREVSLWAGGGITIASNCDAEYQECIDKVGNLLNVLSQADTVK